MIEDKYSVLISDDVCASGCTIETAIILAKALLNEYYNEDDLAVTIKREINI